MHGVDGVRDGRRGNDSLGMWSGGGGYGSRLHVLVFILRRRLDDLLDLFVELLLLRRRSIRYEVKVDGGQALVCGRQTEAEDFGHGWERLRVDLGGQGEGIL